MPSYKLTYFNVRGRAELCRLLFALAGQDYEDKRFELQSDEWKAFKPETLTGQVPVLEIDGRQFSQSIALASYLAKEFGLYGKSNLESLQIDEILGILGDLFNQAIKVIFAGESTKEEVKKEFREKHAPIYLTALAKLLKESGTGYFVRSEVTLADVAVYDMLFTLSEVLTGLLDDYPTLVEHKEKIHSLDKIKQYIDKRPTTPF